MAGFDTIGCGKYVELSINYLEGLGSIEVEEIPNMFVLGIVSIFGK
jgi:hypothetical protein